MKTYRAPGLVLAEREFDIPLDHARPDGERITVFAREVAAPDGLERPYLVFFQGGPGHEAPRVDAPGGWVKRALKDFRVLMLDQRGTGRSSPVTRRTLASRSPAEQADYLAHFRADAIVRDAEHIRRELGVEKWSVLGQSFGGFCATSYLSLHPEGLREALITGGLPPLTPGPDIVYRTTYPRVRERVAEFYARYPDDRERVRDLCALLEGEDVRLPSGDRLTPRRLRAIGAELGHTGGMERVHYLLELDPLDEPFLWQVEDMTSFATHPIYAILHEAAYAHGEATRWSAERLLDEFPDFRDDPTQLTGEMIYPWMFEEHAALAPLREAAELLAARTDWPALYDPQRLETNDVPVAAVAYIDDIYVAYELSRETARRIRGLRLWATNEYEHNGLRADGDRILGRLLAMTRGLA